MITRPNPPKTMNRPTFSKIIIAINIPTTGTMIRPNIKCHEWVSAYFRNRRASSKWSRLQKYPFSAAPLNINSPWMRFSSFFPHHKHLGDTKITRGTIFLVHPFKWSCAERRYKRFTLLNHCKIRPRTHWFIENGSVLFLCQTWYNGALINSFDEQVQVFAKNARNVISIDSGSYTPVVWGKNSWTGQISRYCARAIDKITVWRNDSWENYVLYLWKRAA